MQWRGRLLGPQGLRSKIKALILLVTLVIAFSLVAPFARAETVVATVGVGSRPFGVAYDSLKGEVFVMNDGDNTVVSFPMPSAQASASSAGTELIITAYSDAGLTTPTSRVQLGGSVYLVVSLVDQSGNPVVWNYPGAVQISLSVPAGSLSATVVYITFGNSNTASSFGPVVYIAPFKPGAQRIGASTVLAGIVESTTMKILVLPASAVN